MATLYISEYADVGHINGNIPVASEPLATAGQTVTVSGTSTQSVAFATSTKLIRLVTDTAGCILFGTNPTALQTSPLLPAGIPEYFKVPSGASFKVAIRTP